MKLSLVLPCYNESARLEKVVERVLKVNFCGCGLELLVVDDASTDGSFELAQELSRRHPEVISLKHDRNRGKGAALKTGFSAATGDFIGIQDVDFEYDPADYVKMLSQMRVTGAKVAFGARYWPDRRNRGESTFHRTINRSLTWLSNSFSGLWLHDMETCYKLFDRQILTSILPHLREERFGCEPELVAAVARIRQTLDFSICECPISYVPRGVGEGKKIGWRDGFRAVYCILKYNWPHLPFSRTITTLRTPAMLI